jgi:DNA polymerase III subunit delta'
MSHDLLASVHDNVFLLLKELFEKQKLPHALLFSGPSGIGKKQVAVEFSKILLTDNFNAELHVFSPETAMQNYSIDQIRKIQEVCQVKPYNGSSRVIVIDKADRLGVQPSNAFLKLLEEPPSGNYFILISSCSYKLLPTLLSRVQNFQFKMPDEGLFKLLLEKEGLKLKSLTFLAEGSLGKAHLVQKYQKHLEGFIELLPHSYRYELASYKQILEVMDDEESFNALEFLPLFESLIQDYFSYTCGYREGRYPWTHLLKREDCISYMSLKKALKELNIALEANLKISSSFERFFLSI